MAWRVSASPSNRQSHMDPASGAATLKVAPAGDSHAPQSFAAPVR
jgi:hypothetical protein